ncbi:hypothetical protein Q1695_006579 [Nippostrongylus brasiliensis]|nr:hypothetical protein Q1695_006579 [Nippostrongylus brasiliensis]
MRELLLLFATMGSTVAYTKYAEPLVLAQPNEDGIYVFDMVVERGLSMMTYKTDEYGHGTPVDYSPDYETWTKREVSQAKGCFDHYTLDSNSAEDETMLEDVVVMDGLHRRVLFINGKSPGAPLVVPYKAEVLLRVRNKVLMDGITIHVHGIDKQDLWYMDGVAFVQQCPIHSTNYFEYRFIADNKGTHWYHGHFMTDRGDGLLGGFVVVDKDNRTVPIDGKGQRKEPSREYYIMLQDWPYESTEEAYYKHEDKTMKWMFGYDNPEKCWQATRNTDGGNIGGAAPLSAILINDKGWHVRDDILQRPWALPLERFRIKRNESVLFRVTNGGVSQELMLHIEGHSLLVVAADGDECVPQRVDRLVIFPGERYDVLIEGLSKPAMKSYMLVVETVQYYYFDWTHIDTDYTVAFLEYEDVNLVESRILPTFAQSPECTPTQKCTVLNCPFQLYPSNFNFTCISYDKLRHPTPSEIDKEILQDTSFTSGYEEHFINMHFDSHVDGFKYEHPLGVPYYHSNDMSMVSKDCAKVDCPYGANDNDPRCNCFYHKKHKLGNIVQVGWPSYDVNGMISTLNPDINCAGANATCDGAVWRNTSWMNGAVEGMNTVDPSLRDTITIPVGGYIVLRFRAVNPGWWFAHCHLVLHHMSGTAYAFKVGEDEDIPPPPANFPHDCGYFTMPSIPPKPTKGSYKA